MSVGLGGATNRRGEAGAGTNGVAVLVHVAPVMTGIVTNVGAAPPSAAAPLPATSSPPHPLGRVTAATTPLHCS